MKDLVAESLKNLLALEISELKRWEPKTIADALALSLISMARGQNGEMDSIQAIKIILERTAGRTRQAEQEQSSSTLQEKLKEAGVWQERKSPRKHE